MKLNGMVRNREIKRDIISTNVSNIYLALSPFTHLIDYLNKTFLFRLFSVIFILAFFLFIYFCQSLMKNMTSFFRDFVYLFYYIEALNSKFNRRDL